MRYAQLVICPKHHHKALVRQQPLSTQLAKHCRDWTMSANFEPALGFKITWLRLSLEICQIVLFFSLQFPVPPMPWHFTCPKMNLLFQYQMSQFCNVCLVLHIWLGVRGQYWLCHKTNIQSFTNLTDVTFPPSALSAVLPRREQEYLHVSDSGLKFWESRLQIVNMKNSSYCLLLRS